ncbi:helix-turn-helix domain-containing protein [Gordonia amicalis]|uniref:helix-turn-helix domain-containing protein n=1 Tax=Gordonia amicalis TaxID=89053 RepID=UPI0024B99A28|nr:helix-turn-helix domain-containing protein [Gordonia amicalis]MDJ0454375.1 helix-turn-helix domain-containing protein [Gordonia amicalis]MDV7077736.1 helix-turn-helix domain-containing protein [Gordonia amicalis]
MTDIDDLRDAEAFQYPLKEAATKVRVSEKTLRREYKAGRILFRQYGGRYFVDHEELVRWRNNLPQPAPGELAS